MAGTFATALQVGVRSELGKPPHPGWLPANGSIGVAQPGRPADDAADFQPDSLDDELYGTVEVGVLVVPAVPRPATSKTFETAPPHTGRVVSRVGYLQANPKWVPTILPEPVDDLSTGLPDVGFDETYSVAASYAERFEFGDPIDTASGISNTAHQVDAGLGDTEVLGEAIGIWSIAGRA